MCTPVVDRRDRHAQAGRQRAGGEASVGAGVGTGGYARIRAWFSDAVLEADPGHRVSGKGLVPTAAQPQLIEGGGNRGVSAAGGQPGDGLDHRVRRAPSFSLIGARHHEFCGGLCVPEELHTGLAGWASNRRQGDLLDEV
jgi:hypothetical protein